MTDWMNEWLNEWLNDWLNEWVTERMNDWLNEWMTEWMNDWLDEWMTAWMNEWLWMTDWMTDWLTEWMNEWMIIFHYKYNAYSIPKSSDPFRSTALDMEETLHRGDSEFNFGNADILRRSQWDPVLFPHPPPAPKRLASLFILLKTCQYYNYTWV